MIYLDNSATTKVLPKSAEIASRYYFDSYFNPAASYKGAVQVETEIEKTRKTISDIIGCNHKSIIFTSGGTESNNASLFGCLDYIKKNGNHIITSKIEHPSVYNVFKKAEDSIGVHVDYVSVNPDGTIDLNEFQNLLTDQTSFISIMHINNELGSINDLQKIRSIIDKISPNAVFHSDGVQAFCKTTFDAIKHCDMYSVSGHKLHAVKGIGFLYSNPSTPFKGGQLGGGQENNLRSGTLNVPGIMSLGYSIKEYSDHQIEWNRTMSFLKDRLYRNLTDGLVDVLVNGPDPDKSAPHILNLSFIGVRGEVLLNALSEKEIYVSTGSACSERKKGQNRILTSIGVTGLRQESAIRFSLSHFNTEAEIDEVSQVIIETVNFLRKYRRR